MTAIPEDVAARAKAAALSSWMSNPGVHALNGLVDFYLSCYTAERPRIELAALKARVKEVCDRCRNDHPIDQIQVGVFVHRVAPYRCPASPLHASIAELRAEIEKGER